MATLVQIPYVWAALLAIAAAFDQARFDRLLPLADRIEAGDSQAEVLAVLGQPQSQWQSAGLFSNGPPTWAYGTNLAAGDIVRSDSQFPEPIPIRLRLFSPYEDDLVITFNGQGAVESVVRP